MDEAGGMDADVRDRINTSPHTDVQEIKDGSLAYESAHNLMQLYAAVGNMELVRQKSAWLAI